MILSYKEQHELQEAILSAFPSEMELAMMVKYKLEQKLNQIASGNTFSVIVFALIEWAEAHGKFDDLIQGAYEFKPNNPKLKEFHNKYYNIPIPPAPSLKRNFIDIAVDNQPSTLSAENNQLNWNKIPFDIIQTAYKESLPPNIDAWDFNKPEEIIKYLKKCQSFYEFLIKLSKNQLLPEIICNQLRELASAEKKQENKPVPQERLKSYLIVSIKPCKNTKSFLLNAWLVEDDSLPRDSLSNIDFKPLINEGTTQPGLVCDFEKIPEIFKQILEEALDYLLKIEKEYSLTIEFFLPKDLMCTAVEQWKIDNTINEISVGTMYAIHLRSVERQDMNYLRKHRSPWLAKWNQLRAILDTKEQSVESFHSHQEATFDYKSLKMILDTKIGLKATCVSTDTQVALLKAILLATTPIAVWARHSLPNLDNEIDKILFTKPLNNLCESIRIARETADGEEKHLGNHLTLLWENPYRLIPDVMSKLRVTGQ